jgi:hypothetical protein
MKPIRIFPEGSYINGIEFSSETQYNLFVDTLPQGTNKEEVNILMLSEPDIITGIAKNLPNHYEMFDCILTHNQDVLDKYENSKLFVFNSVWASDKDYSPKEFNISTIVGNKTWTKQQIMRQELWFMQDQIPNRKFYASSFGPPSNTFGNPSIGENKDDLFKSQFHIAIENCSVENYFTEKILDCFISKTIPIYCGCVNIEKFFNDKGVMKFKNIKECIDICNNLNENTYQEMIQFVEENYQKALEYIDWRIRIKTSLEQLKLNKQYEQL